MVYRSKAIAKRAGDDSTYATRMLRVGFRRAGGAILDGASIA